MIELNEVAAFEKKVNLELFLECKYRKQIVIAVYFSAAEYVLVVFGGKGVIECSSCVFLENKRKKEKCSTLFMEYYCLGKEGREII